MARAIHTRLILKGILEAQTPLSLSGAQTGLVADITVARNGLGQIYLPGTSLAGTLRSYSEHLQLPARDRNTLLGWWGGHLEDDPASRFLVDDAPIVNETRLELWHGVGIDRQWGTAAKGVLYEREVVPRGAQFSFNLELETGEPAELGLARAVMQTLRQALSEGRIGIGGATTRGLGQIKLTQSRASEQNWNSRAGVLAALRGDAEEAGPAWQEAQENLQLELPLIKEISIFWQPLGPVMSKASRDGLAVDILPMVSGNGEQIALVLPGSSIKGSLRSQAEKIVRTVLGAGEFPPGRTRHLAQVELPLVREIFGAAKPAGSQEADRGRRAALAVASCYSAVNIERQQWQDLAAAPSEDPSPVPEKLKAMGLAGWRHAFHVAIDRWTGGAAEGFLYSGLEPGPLTWEPIRLRLDLNLLSEEKPALALLYLTLRDLDRGRIALGFGANRGYGSLKVNKLATDLEALKGFPEPPLELETAFRDWVATVERA